MGVVIERRRTQPEATPSEKPLFEDIEPEVVKAANVRSRSIQHPVMGTLLVTFGIRWREELKEPRWEVSAYRKLYHGDTIGWNGSKVAGFAGAEDLVDIAALHGKAPTPEDEAFREKFDITAPAGPEKIADLLLPWQVGKV